MNQSFLAPALEKRMNKPNVKGQRLVALFVLGNLLFNYPLLALFNRPDTVLGIPLLYLYVFGAWALLIALMALTVRQR
ncbi:MAG: hypothetical protein V7606_811 [Burkholderiales bacterium]